MTESNITDPDATARDAQDLRAFFLNPPPIPKRQLHVLTGGANRGARENAPVFLDVNRRSTAVEVVPIYVDPVPGRAAAQQRFAEELGLRAGAIEERIERVVASIGTAAHDPVVLHIDQASGHASVLRALSGVQRAILSYIVVKLPTNRIMGVASVYAANELEARGGGASFNEVLAHVTERNTSDMILGERGDPAHVRLEPEIRKWFRAHTAKNLEKIMAGLEPVSNTFEVTLDGRETLPLFIVLADRWSDPGELAQRVLANPSMPIRRGVRLMVAETVAGEGIRFHDVRRRSDDKITLGGVEVIDRESVERAQRERAALQQALREAAQRQAQEVRSRAERETLSLRNPVWTTD